MTSDIKNVFLNSDSHRLIVFFGAKDRYEGSYIALLELLNKKGYAILFFPFNHTKIYDEAIKEKEISHGHPFEEVNILSHLQGDNNAQHFKNHTTYSIAHIVIASPTSLFDTIFERDNLLILWADNDKKYLSPLTANTLYINLRMRHNVRFIGYPNVSSYLFAGIYYSQYHDEVDINKIENKEIDYEKYNHLDEEVIDDIDDFYLNKKEKEKVAIFVDNYLPFSNGVNILTHILKEELIKLGIKAYVVTFRIKEHNYITPTQKKNVILLNAHYTIGGKKECLFVCFRPLTHANKIRPYGFNYIHLQTEFFISKIAYTLKSMEQLPMFYTAHTMWNDMFDKRYSRFKAPWVKFFANLTMIKSPLRHAEVMSVPTNKVKLYYQEHYHRDRNVVVLPGCVDADNFKLPEDGNERLLEFRQRYHLEGKQVIGYVGRVSLEKHVHVVFDYFLRVKDEYPDLVFMVVGEGTYLPELSKQVKENNLEGRVILTGAVPNPELRYYYRLFNCFCTASTFETQGLTYIESMWCRTPLLVKNDSCLDHFLVPNQNGLIFVSFDDWKDGLDRILAGGEEITSIIDKAYETAEAYDKTVWAKRLFFLYQESKLIKDKKQKTVNLQKFRKVK